MATPNREIPIDRLYTRDHEWITRKPSPNGLHQVGITHHAQSELGDVVFVELPKPGDALTQGKTFGVVESVKAASDLFSPASGMVRGVNARLIDAPDLVNKDPYGQKPDNEGGWMLEIEISNADELANLMDAPSYAQYLESLK